MRARVAASAALAVVLAGGLAGCNFLTPQATEKHYDASDGVSGQIGDVRVLNVLAIAGDSDTTARQANLVFTAVNSGDSDVQLKVQYGSTTKELTVEPGSTKVGYDQGSERLQLAKFGARPGALAKIYFQYGNEQGTQLRVPVLDDSWASYSDLAPTKAPKPKPTATATGTPVAPTPVTPPPSPSTNG